MPVRSMQFSGAQRNHQPGLLAPGRISCARSLPGVEFLKACRRASCSSCWRASNMRIEKSACIAKRSVSPMPSMSKCSRRVFIRRRFITSRHCAMLSCCCSAKFGCRTGPEDGDASVASAYTIANDRSGAEGPRRSLMHDCPQHCAWTHQWAPPAAVAHQQMIERCHGELPC